MCKFDDRRLIGYVPVACVLLPVPLSEVFVASISGGNLQRVSESDDPVRLRERQERGIGCIAVVKSSSVHPVIKVIVGGTDWTHLFAASETLHSLPPANDSVVAPVNAMFRLLYVTMKPERRFNGHTLECSATTDGFPPVSATAAVIVEC